MTEIVLDVRGLEPPEPYEQATALLPRLKHGQYVRMISPRRPRLLYPWLQQHGLREITRERNADLFEIFIWAAADAVAESLVNSLG
ncbi:MAG: DUF2249 domain-containing protein [Gammaproteobacteria bacterium]|nr:MAG: DUF2249 domain-containing protein [Gammaproteobacteria bacterium]